MHAHPRARAQPQANNYKKWLKAQLLNRHPVVWMIMCKGDSHKGFVLMNHQIQLFCSCFIVRMKLHTITSCTNATQETMYTYLLCLQDIPQLRAIWITSNRYKYSTLITCHCDFQTQRLQQMHWHALLLDSFAKFQPTTHTKANARA